MYISCPYFKSGKCTKPERDFFSDKCVALKYNFAACKNVHPAKLPK